MQHSYSCARFKFKTDNHEIQIITIATMQLKEGVANWKTTRILHQINHDCNNSYISSATEHLEEINTTNMERLSRNSVLCLDSNGNLIKIEYTGALIEKFSRIIE